MEIEIDPRHSGRHPARGVQKALVVSHKLTRFFSTNRGVGNHGDTVGWKGLPPQRKQTQDETSIRSTGEILINLFMPYRIEVLLKFEIGLSRKVFLSFPEEKHLCFEYTHI